MNPLKDRYPFEEAIKSPKLLKVLWDGLSVPQQTVVLAMYGIELPTLEHQAAWSILNGNAVFDNLGYPTKIFHTDYLAKEFQTIVALLGRRSGKSYIMCMIALYEICMGGHMARMTTDEPIIVPYIAQDLATAKKNMQNIELFARKIPVLHKLISKVAADRIEFFNGRLTVVAEPPTIKTGRGWAIPLNIMDEVGVWYKNAENANPDFEVMNAIRPAMMQFTPYGKQLIISSPYTEEGILFKYAKAGTDGHNATVGDEDPYQYLDTLVLVAPTASMQNPVFINRDEERKYLLKEQARDPDGFKREYLAQFVSSVDSFISSDVVAKAVDTGVHERQLKDVRKDNYRPQFVAAMDPAFRHDSFAFSLFHRDDKGVVHQDLLRVWTPDKKLGIVLNPRTILQEIGMLLRQWGITLVYSDQYQLESLQQLAMQEGFSVIGVDFTGRSKAKMYGSLRDLLRTDKLRLLDHSKVFQQLVKLSRKITPMGGVQIAAPPGHHDDVASVIALGVNTAVQLYGYFEATVAKEPTLEELCRLDMARKKRQALEDQWA